MMTCKSVTLAIEWSAEKKWLLSQNKIQESFEKKMSPKMHRLGSFQFFYALSTQHRHIRATSSPCQLRWKFEESAH